MSWSPSFQLRKTLSDFGLGIAVLVVVGTNRLLFGSLDDQLTTKLRVGTALVPSKTDRNWLVSLWPILNDDTARNLNWVAGAAILPGFVLFLVLFVETESTE